MPAPRPMETGRYGMFARCNENESCKIFAINLCVYVPKAVGLKKTSSHIIHLSDLIGEMLKGELCNCVLLKQKARVRFGTCPSYAGNMC